MIKMQGLTGALVSYLICTSLDQMPTLISTSMPPSITNGDLPLLAQKQTIVKIEICSKYDISKEITSFHFYCLPNMIMLEHLEAASLLTRTGAGQRTERKIRYIDKEWFSMDIHRIKLQCKHLISYQEGVDGDDLEDAGGTEHPVVEVSWTSSHQCCNHSCLHN